MIFFDFLQSMSKNKNLRECIKILILLPAAPHFLFFGALSFAPFAPLLHLLNGNVMEFSWSGLGVFLLAVIFSITGWMAWIALVWGYVHYEELAYIKLTKFMKAAMSLATLYSLGFILSVVEKTLLDKEIEVALIFCVPSLVSLPLLMKIAPRFIQFLKRKRAP